MSRNFIRAVLFDLGGTLMYERESWHTVNARADEVLTNYLRGQGDRSLYNLDNFYFGLFSAVIDRCGNVVTRTLSTRRPSISMISNLKPCHSK